MHSFRIPSPKDVKISNFRFPKPGELIPTRPQFFFINHRELETFSRLNNGSTSTKPRHSFISQHDLEEQDVFPRPSDDDENIVFTIEGLKVNRPINMPPITNNLSRVIYYLDPPLDVLSININKVELFTYVRSKDRKQTNIKLWHNGGILDRKKDLGNILKTSLSRNYGFIFPTQLSLEAQGITSIDKENFLTLVTEIY